MRDLWSAQRWQGPGAAPVVLTLALRDRDPCGRWKEIYEERPGLLNHHLEIRSPDQVDDSWAGDRAWEQAG